MVTALVVLWLLLDVMKFQLYCSCLQSDGRYLRFVRNFDALSDCQQFIKDFRHILQPDWKIVQTHVNVTDRELNTLYKYAKVPNEPELPF